jgi:L-ascorbate metabolism protein UlaG (beta-lactamase superfamily)
MKQKKWLVVLIFAFVLGLGWSLARAQTVKIIPLGAVAGEFCAGDRALLFEDPTGVRVLTAPGRTVNGSGDPRIAPVGSVHVVLVDHPHVDHIGDVFHTNCAGTMTTPFAFPSEGNAPEIAAVHNSAVLVGGELPDFFTKKISNVATALGTLGPEGCPAAGLDNTLTVPRNRPCVGVIRGGTRTAVFEGQSTGVKITTIPAFHAAGASRMHIDEPNVPEGLTGYAGSETGYIIRFTNGLSVLWTGDSGLIGDWRTQSRFYRPNLAIPHIGDLFTMGPDEAAFAVKRLIRPKSVIPEHANQVSTTGGTVNPGTRLERFIDQVNGTKVVVPLSGVPISCDGEGNCTQGQ